MIGIETPRADGNSLRSGAMFRKRSGKIILYLLHFPFNVRNLRSKDLDGEALEIALRQQN